MGYQLRSKESKSIVGTFETKEAAFGAIRLIASVHSREYAENHSLGVYDGGFSWQVIGEGAELLQTAMAENAERERSAREFFAWVRGSTPPEDEEQEEWSKVLKAATDALDLKVPEE